MSHGRVYGWHDPFICVTHVPWLIHICDTSHECVWHDSFKRVTWLIQPSSRLCVSLLSILLRSFTCVTWLIHLCVAWLIRVWYDSFIRVTRLVHSCDMTHAYVCAVTHSYVRSSLLCASGDTAEVIHMCDLTHSYVWLIHTCATIHHESAWRAYTRVFRRDTRIHDVIMNTRVCIFVMNTRVFIMNTRDASLQCVWHDSFICVTWLIHISSPLSL